MKRYYIKPESEVYAAFYQGHPLLDTISVNTADVGTGGESNTPADNEWGTNEFNSLWEDYNE